MATLPAFSAQLPVSTKINPNPCQHCLALPIFSSSVPSRNFALRSHGVAGSFSFKYLKAAPNHNEKRRLRRVKSAEEEKTLVPEQVEDIQSSSQPEEQGEAVSSSSLSEQQPVSVPVSPSDSLSMLFQADGTMSEASIPAVTKALEGMEGVSNLNVQVVEGIASVELSKLTTVQATGVASSLVETIQGSGFKLQTLNLSFEDYESALVS